MLFPEDNFKDTALNGMALKSLVRDYSIEADELMDWLEKGCFDALEKKYLRTMIFGIYLNEENPEKLVESYTFNFSYPAKDLWSITIDAAGKEAFKLRTRGEIMKATSDMLRRLLILTQTLKPLPENAYITMKLYYYDDVTPSDYEPPLFKSADDEQKFYFATKPEKIRVGMVETPHHAVKLQVQTAPDGIQPTDDDIQAMEIDEEEEEYFTTEWSQSSRPQSEGAASAVSENATSRIEQQDSPVATPALVTDRIGELTINALDTLQAMDLDDGSSGLTALSSSACSTPRPVTPEPALSQSLAPQHQHQTSKSSIGRDGEAPGPIAVSSPFNGAESAADTQDLIRELRSGAKHDVPLKTRATTAMEIDEPSPSPTNKLRNANKSKNDVSFKDTEDDEDLDYCCPMMEIASNVKAVIPGAMPCASGTRAMRTHAFRLSISVTLVQISMRLTGQCTIWNGPGKSPSSGEVCVELSVATQLVNRLRGGKFLTHGKLNHTTKKKSSATPIYNVVKTPKARAAYNRWFSDAVLPRKNPNGRRGRPKKSDDVRQDETNTSGDEGEASADDVTKTDSATEMEDDSACRNTHMPTPDTTSRHRSSRLPAETLAGEPAAGQGTRETSVSATTPHPATARITRAMSAALSAADEGSPSLPTPKSAKTGSVDPTLKKKFLEQFDESSDTQMTGFEPSQMGTPRRKRSFSETASPKPTASPKRKSRKVSVVKRGIAVL
ncbi:HORMA domain-containing protein 1 [Rhizophlyctis rosea]|nr:HORMA domain-containing protein 1 [Rhizophlyctis rosea]